jgi:hypothetical protein
MTAQAQSIYTPYTFTTLAGQTGSSGSVDGTGSAALFNEPQGLAVDSAGNLYVADSRNYTIRKVTPAGVVTTVAGQAGSYGDADGIGNAARFGTWGTGPQGITVDAAGSIYVAVAAAGTIRKITPEGVDITLAGSAGQWGSADGQGRGAILFPLWHWGGWCRQCVRRGLWQLHDSEDHTGWRGADGGGIGGRSGQRGRDRERGAVRQDVW